MISYMGGKNRMAEWIYQFIPKEIDTYSEPFGGAFWVYFNTKLDYTHIPNIRYNDINKFMSNLFCCAQNYEKLISVFDRELSKGGFLYSDKSDLVKYKEFYKSLYYDFKNNPKNTFLDDNSFQMNDYEVAMKYAFLITSSFNGCFPKAAGFSGISDDNLKLNALINKLNNKKYQDKLDRITSFENLDFVTFITKYDDERTFYYLDPPYFDAKDVRLNYYGVKSEDSFGHSSHARLAQVLQNTRAKWALSYYYFEGLEEWFPRDKYTWISKDFFRSSASFSEGKEVKGTEILILNYLP